MSKSWYEVGFQDGNANSEERPPAGGRMSIRDAYRRGFNAGKIDRLLRNPDLTPAERAALQAEQE